ncbi:MAG: pirin family protein [Chloroherpetonaceae bacterium]
MTDVAKKSASVKIVYPIQSVMEGEGFIVNRAFPRRGLSFIDPFLLLDELPPRPLLPGEAKGTPPHPHKGFEILSYVLKGAMTHEDSLGNKAALNEGDVQWMTAGRGIVHKEQPSDDLKRNGGIWQGFQVWINLPASKKNIEPGYQEIRASEIPTYHGEGFSVKILVGSAFGITSPIQPHTPVEYHHYTLAPKATVEVAVHQEHNTFLYPLSGAFQIGELEVARGVLPLLDKDGDRVMLVNPSAEEPAEFIFFSGKPLNEPVARYGPFVMNSEVELERAFYEFQTGQMGVLTD